MLAKELVHNRKSSSLPNTVCHARKLGLQGATSTAQQTRRTAGDKLKRAANT